MPTRQELHEIGQYNLKFLKDFVHYMDAFNEYVLRQKEAFDNFIEFNEKMPKPPVYQHKN